MKKFLKNTLIFLLVFVVAELLIYFIGTGFIRNRYVAVEEFSVSQDGKEMTLSVSVPSSIGYIREVKTERYGAELRLDFYSAFGGMNGNIGAKKEYTITLDDDITVISVFRGESGYEYVLFRDWAGTWKKMQ